MHLSKRLIRKKILNLFDGVVDFVTFEIFLRDGKTKLKIFRQDKNQLKKKR
jgi:hypothetical protein